MQLIMRIVLLFLILSIERAYLACNIASNPKVISGKIATDATDGVTVIKAIDVLNNILAGGYSNEMSGSISVHM